MANLKWYFRLESGEWGYVNAMNRSGAVARVKSEYSAKAVYIGRA